MYQDDEFEKFCRDRYEKICKACEILGIINDESYESYRISNNAHVIDDVALNQVNLPTIL